MNVTKEVIASSIRFTNQQRETIATFRHVRPTPTAIQAASFKAAIEMVRQAFVSDVFLLLTEELSETTGTTG